MFLKFGEESRVKAGEPQARHLALHDDALARRERQAVGDAVHLTEAALDAAVDDVVGERHWLDVVNETLRVVVENHSGIEQPLGVKETLDVSHNLKRLVSPLVPHKRGHIAPRAVLGLERAVILVDHQFDNLLHQVAVARHLLWGVETLGDDEVVVALEGVAVDARVVVAVVDEHLREVFGGLWQVVDVEGDILDDDGGSQGSRAAHLREDAAAYGPIFAVLLRVAREACRHGEFKGPQGVFNPPDVGLEFVLAVGKGLDEHSGERLAGGVAHAGERLAVEQFGAVDGSRLEGDDGLAGGAHPVEV